MDRVLNAFLERQLAEGMALTKETANRLSLHRLPGNPPSAYVARFSCLGLINDPTGVIMEFNRWDIGIRFPGDYLRAAPSAAEVLTYLGPCPTVWHPNIRPPFVCLHLVSGTPLVELLYGLYDLLTWNVFAVGDDGLNKTAAQWARHQPSDRFPVDRRPLRTRSGAGTPQLTRPRQPQPT